MNQLSRLLQHARCHCNKLTRTCNDSSTQQISDIVSRDYNLSCQQLWLREQAFL
jgi:hypothetical protein